ncbi:hypothetical protein GPALN_006073 [Globodera pallida]|nr:hypothetical protein GPALN_006073 [Globodera pallida]
MLLVKLKNIGAGTYSLLKFAGPIGQIMHTGISLALKEDSEELQAIKSLRETMTTKFDEISRKIDHQMLGIVCSSVLAKGNEYDYQREIQIYENLTRDIAQHMLKWIHNELALAWPDIIIAQSLEAMGSKDYSEKEYVELATLIQRVANERGSDK